MDAAVVEGFAAGTVSRCTTCGRRYPLRTDRCHGCRSDALVAEPFAPTADVLSWTVVHRGRPASLLPVPYTVVHVREVLDDAGADARPACFDCPLVDAERPPAVGTAVALGVRTWSLPGGDVFTGVVARTAVADAVPA